MKKGAKTALGAIVGALSVSLMFSAALLPMFTYAVPAAAAVLLIPVVIEAGKKWAAGVYAAVSMLGVLTVPDKEAALMYAFFFGYYPIIKAFLEQKLPSVACWAVKIVLFNVSVTAAYFLMVKLLGLPFDELERYGAAMIPALLGIGTAAFVLYDYALTKMVGTYLVKWQKVFRKIFKLA